MDINVHIDNTGYLWEFRELVVERLKPGSRSRHVLLVWRRRSDNSCFLRLNRVFPILVLKLGEII